MLIENSKLKAELGAIAPTRIAVAYIGADWQTFVDPRGLQTVVLSPTLGSNPRAIAELANEIGWENVWFLDVLHSKLYIGECAVLLGSANLSKNAFAHSGNEELCVRLCTPDIVQDANRLFLGYIESAQKQYPDESAKLGRLEKLREEHRKAISYGLIREPQKRTKSFSEYDPGRDGMVYIAWYKGGEYEYTDDVPQGVQADIATEMNLAPNDLRPTNQWVLTWRQTTRGMADARSKPEWVYVHEVFDKGCDEEGYEMLSIQRASLALPEAPFDEKEAAFVNTFRTVIDRPEFAPLRGTDERTWRLRDNRKLMRRFIDDLKNEYRRKKW